MKSRKKNQNFTFFEFAMLLAIKFPTKWCVFQPSRSKTVGEDTFFAAKS